MFESFIFYVLVTSILIILCSSAVTSRRDKSILYSRSSLTLLIITTIVMAVSYDSQFQGKSVALYHGLFHSSATIHVFSLFILLISALIVQLNSFYGRKIWNPSINILKSMYSKLIYHNNFILNKMSEQYRIIEYSVIMVFIIIGGILLLSSFNFISVFLCIELQSYGLYILCCLYRNSEKAVEAGLTYFLLGGLSSCFILLGLALIYGNLGNVNFDALFILNISAGYWDPIIMANDHFAQAYYVNYALIIMSIGFLFKVTAAPFHFWAPDVYDAIPTIVTTFVAIFTKISIFILLLHVIDSSGDLFRNHKLLDLASNLSWIYTLLISSLLSMIIGSVLGLTQFRIKRLYAYSTINHIGFILLALSITSVESIQSFIFYLLQYSLANVNAFLLIIAIGYSLYIYTEKNEKAESISKFLYDVKNSPIQLVSQLKGYFYINPAIALSLTITLFSFVGIPPLIGFFAKQMVLSSALSKGYIFMSLVAILTSVISAYYYLALIKQMFFSPTDYIINPYLENMQLKGSVVHINSNKVLNNITIRYHDIKINSYLSMTISIVTIIILLFILDPQEWLSLANVLALILYNS